MGMPIRDPWLGGGGRADLGVVLIGGGTGNTYFWVRNVCGETPYGKDHGGGGSTTGW